MTDPNASRLLIGATDLARKNGHAFVGTEHLFASLLEDGAENHTAVLREAGLDLVKVKEGLLKGLRPSPEPGVADPPVSRFARQAVDRAAVIAKANGRSEPHGGDLLAALLEQPRGRILETLGGQGPLLESIRAKVLPVAPGGESAGVSSSQRTNGKATAEKRTAKSRQPHAAPQESQRPPEARAKEKDKKRTVPEPTPERSHRGADRESDYPPRRIAKPQPGSFFSWSTLLLLAVPVSIVLKTVHASPVLIFFTACLGVLPLAGLMGQATESLADRTGPTVGGLLNATFGNAAELIIALVALRAGMVELVKASITGSILGNLLLILGLSFVAGGLKGHIVKFSRTNAGMSAAMLSLAVIGLVFPELHHVMGTGRPAAELHLSEMVAGVLILTYLLSLVFSLKTHKALFGGGDHPAVEPKWTVGVSVGILAAATAGIALESELLVSSIESVTATLGLSQAFLGLVILPIIGNAAEHATAVVVARKGQMDLALQIALGSSTQVALLVAPLLVFAGVAFGVQMNLVFPMFDIAALAVSTIVVAIITLDGETHWFEGVQLLAVYALMAAAALMI